MITQRRGFTLIELLVAISILAIVAVLGWRGLDSIIRARVALNSDLEETRGLQLAFAQMQSDCGQIANAKSIGGRKPLNAQAGQLTLVRAVFAENQPSRMQVVAYRIRNGVLTRRESVATRDLKEIDTAWTTAMSESNVMPAVVLHSNVDEMAIRSWINDGAGWRTGTEGAPVSGTIPGTAAMTEVEATGLEVALKLHGRPSSLIKIFLLGAA
jgi:general secretion pathway protein J